MSSRGKYITKKLFLLLTNNQSELKNGEFMINSVSELSTVDIVIDNKESDENEEFVEI